MRARRAMRIEYHSGTDNLGRCCFTKFWISDYHPGDPAGEHRMAERGQVFYADPLTHGFARPSPLEDCRDGD